MNVKTILEVVGEGLEMIGLLVQNKRVRDAAAIVDAIERIYAAIDGVATKRITPAEATAQLQKLRTQLGNNDASADDALADKFDTSDS